MSEERPIRRMCDAVDDGLIRLGKCLSWLNAILIVVIVTQVTLRYGFGRGTMCIPGARTRPGPQRLWLCIYLPRLALDVFRRQWAGVGAVFEEQQGIRRIRCIAPHFACSRGLAGH